MMWQLFNEITPDLQSKTEKQQILVYSYQTSVAEIEAELSGYVPVCMLLYDSHIRELDRAAVMIELQLQTRGFLYVWKTIKGGEVIQGVYSNQMKVPVSMAN